MCYIMSSGKRFLRAFCSIQIGIIAVHERNDVKKEKQEKQERKTRKERKNAETVLYSSSTVLLQSGQ